MIIILKNMKPIKILAFCVSLVVLAAFTYNKTSFGFGQKELMATIKEAPSDTKGFALLELFTSEGCSSCPAADALLARIQQEAQDKPIYVLAYHVDYWDRLGWKDIFSNPDFTRRQNEYGGWMNLNSVYTPQVVINGKKECVGSDASALNRAITGALATVPSATVVLSARQNGDKLTVDYEVSGGSVKDRLSIAVVQKLAVSKVERGENSGRTLTHAQIVRELQQVSLTAEKKGSSSIKLPQGFTAAGWEVVGFVQNARNGEVLGVAKAVLN